MTAFQTPLVVLLADDDENDAFLVRRTLYRFPSVQRVMVLPDAERTITYLQAQGRPSDRGNRPLPGVLILDQWMPGLSGLDMLCWLRSQARLAFLPVVILSGALSLTQTEQAGRLKAACCAKKPDGPEMKTALDHAIRSALGLVRQAWFDSKAAYATPYWPVNGTPERIRVWT